MPRNYTRKTTWGQTPLAEMESAAAEVMQGKKSLRKAGRDRNIDKTTLKRFIKKKKKGEVKSVAWGAVAEAKRIFTDEMEEELAKHLKQLADQFHGLAPVNWHLNTQRTTISLSLPIGQRNNVQSDVPVPLDDEFDKESSEDERSDPGNTDLSVGDFVLVNFATKHRSLRYVGMVEKVEDDEILTQFLRRIQGNKKEWERPMFAVKENDVAHVPKGDVVKKLPQTNRPGGTTRREQLFTFPCNLQGWNVEYR
ncbi:hypothetical protein VZT92_019523 [Zoarces viviparus]|uniref:Uncharacterized protein n=1 Tax=Zoarces viviparus TaxID=48416 RepID=A0AAW1EKG8_ZOAVI